MLECVVNISEGRRADVVAALTDACGNALLDVHVDPDHHRSVFTLVGAEPMDTERAVRDLSCAAATRVDLARHEGVHPRFGVVDVVPFVAIDGESHRAVAAARDFAHWIADALSVPAFLYGDADPRRRTLPELRRDAFRGREPDFGPDQPDPHLGATAVGARPPLVALNCELDRDDVELARAIARRVREHDGGLPGVRALGLRLASRGRAQVSLNLVEPGSTGMEEAWRAVDDLAKAAGARVARIELVGLVTEAELSRTSPAFRRRSGIDRRATVEARLAERPVPGAPG